MESKLVEYARAVVEDAVDVDADFFKNSEMQCLFEQLCSHNILILLELLFLTF